MLSFYEFDLLLQNQNKINEGLGEERLAKLMAAIAAKKAKKDKAMQLQPPAAKPDPVSQSAEPVSQPPAPTSQAEPASSSGGGSIIDMLKSIMAQKQGGSSSAKSTPAPTAQAAPTQLGGVSPKKVRGRGVGQNLPQRPAKQAAPVNVDDKYASIDVEVPTNPAQLQAAWQSKEIARLQSNLAHSQIARWLAADFLDKHGISAPRDMENKWTIVPEVGYAPEQIIARSHEIYQIPLGWGNLKLAVQLARRVEDFMKASKQAWQSQEFAQLQKNLYYDPSARHLAKDILDKIGIKTPPPEQKWIIVPEIGASPEQFKTFSDYIEIPIPDLNIAQKIVRYIKGKMGGGRANSITNVEGVPFETALEKMILTPGGKVTEKQAGQFKFIVKRARDMMSHIFDRDIIGKPMTVAELAQALSAKEQKSIDSLFSNPDDPMAPAKSIFQPNPELDLQAMILILKTALKPEQKVDGQIGPSYPFFQVKGNPSDPNTLVRVVPLKELSNPAGPEERRGGPEVAMGQVKYDPSLQYPAHIRLAQSLGLDDAHESTKEEADWMKIVMLMEHWGF
jgi:hypothetical protein